MKALDALAVAVSEIYHARLYPNLNEVVDKGLVEKGELDKRPNYYTITARGQRESDCIHVRGVHYTVYMSDEDVQPPTDCSWDTYDNTQRCYGYPKECAVLARILGYIPLDGIIDKRAHTRTVTEYGTHTLEPDPESIAAPTGVSTPQIPHPEARAESVFDRDETRYSEWAADHVASSAREQLPFDKARQSPYHIELWSEKTLPITSATRAGWLRTVAVTSWSKARSISPRPSRMSSPNESERRGSRP